MKFIQQAYKGINEWWAYLVTIVLLLFGWQFIGVIPLFVTAYIYAENTEEFIASAIDNFSSLGIDSNLYLVCIVNRCLNSLIK